MMESITVAITGLTESIIVTAITGLSVVTLTWIISIYLKDSSIVDIVWGLGFIVIAITNSLYFEINSIRQLLILIVVTIWGARLSGYLAIRNANKPEDWRYQKFRQNAGDIYWLTSYFKVFLLQGAIMCFISLPMVVIFGDNNPSSLTIIDYLGVSIFFVGLLTEGIADAQMYIFKKKHSSLTTKEAVLNTGLWKYSRHPNYLGEIVLWFGIGIIGLSSEYGYLSLISPLLLTFIMIKISGVSMLESELINTKPKYNKYISKTPSLFPNLLKRNK